MVRRWVKVKPRGQKLLDCVFSFYQLGAFWVPLFEPYTASLVGFCLNPPKKKKKKTKKRATLWPQPKQQRGIWIGTVNLKRMVPSAKPRAKPVKIVSSKQSESAKRKKLGVFLGVL